MDRRLHAGERKHDPGFTERLTARGGVYVNDAFGSLHCSHASTAGLGKLPASRPRPFAAILGGERVSDKIGAFDDPTGEIDAFVVGGAMAFTFLAARHCGL